MEYNILDFIKCYIRSEWLDRCMVWITQLGNGGMIWILCTILLLLIPKTRKAGALGIEVICCNGILKPLVARIRPCDLRPETVLLIAHPSGYSFPSGHTASSFAAAFSLCFSRNKLWIPAMALAALIGFSRLYLYVHFPSDVLAGIVLGALCGWAGAFTANRLFRKK